MEEERKKRERNEEKEITGEGKGKNMKRGKRREGRREIKRFIFDSTYTIHHLNFKKRRSTF